MEDTLGISIHASVLEDAKARVLAIKRGMKTDYVSPYDFVYYGRLGGDFSPKKYKFFYRDAAYGNFKSLKMDLYTDLLGKIAEEKGDWVAP